MPIIMYNAENTHTLNVGKGPDGDLKSFKYRFVPGPNNVPEEKWERLQAESSGCQNLLSMSKLKPLMQSAEKVEETKHPQAIEAGGGKKTTDKPGKVSKPTPAGNEAVDDLDDVDVTKMDAWSARDLILGVINIALLRKFHKQETKRKGIRKMVMTALDEQIKAVETPEKDNEGGQADLKANDDKQK